MRETAQLHRIATSRTPSTTTLSARPSTRSREDASLSLSGSGWKRYEAARILERLVLEKADVVVQNLAPGAAARLGLGYEKLSALKRGLIEL